MPLAVNTASADDLRHLPTAARPKVDPADVWVPDGYQVEAVVVGLSLPTGMNFGADGTLYLMEGGSTWPTRPYLPPRILRLRPDGTLDTLAVEELAGPRGISQHGEHLYVSVKGGEFGRIVRYDLDGTGRTVVLDGFPSGGWHEPGGPLFTADGWMLFSFGSVSQQGVVLPQGFMVDMARQPLTHDVPGQDVTLTGNDVQANDPSAPYPFYNYTGAFKPFGTPSTAGEVVKGQLKCSSGVWRARPDGTELELLAWGIRNPYGLALTEAGQLYASDNDFEETGLRAIAHDPDRVWHVKAASRPPGTVATPDWYGFPDVCADGLPVYHETHLPTRGTPAKPLLKDPPPWAGPAAFLEKPHSGMCKMDFCKTDAFPGHRGRLFLAEFGTYAPMNTPHAEDATHGFKVVSIDVDTGTATDFVRNPRPGPASLLGTGGIERPVDCKFGPDGRSLYVLDFGHSPVDPSKVLAYGHTGVLWRVTPR